MTSIENTIPTTHNVETARTPELRSSVGVRGLPGDGLSSKDNTTYHEMFTKNTKYMYELKIIQFGECKFYSIEDTDSSPAQYYPYEQSLFVAVQHIKKNAEYNPYSAYRSDIMPPFRNIIETEGTVLHTVHLYAKLNDEYPTMYVYGVAVIDVRVPLDFIFFPFIVVWISPNLYAGPITHPNADPYPKKERCANCSTYGSFRGVFIALCATCVDCYNDPKGCVRFGYRGYEGFPCGFSDIHPDNRNDALPIYLEGTPLEDIGYSDLIIDSCSAVVLSKPNPSIEPRYITQDELRNFRTFFDVSDQEDDEYIDNDDDTRYQYSDSD
jgi:hypothetical protein